jgi:hypothetical protein
MSSLEPPGTPGKLPKGATINGPIVTVAFPFSQIKSQEPSLEMRELAALVNELAAQLADFRPSPATKELSERAQALIEKLG